MTKPNDQTVSTWIDLVRAYDAVFSEIHRALKGAGFPPLTWYDVLLELDRASPHGLRPFELQAKVLLPQYGLSRLVSRIEEKGYLERIHCEDDGRGQHLKITSSGKVLRGKMWRVYGKILQDTVGAKFADEQAKQLSILLRNIT